MIYTAPALEIFALRDSVVNSESQLLPCDFNTSNLCRKRHPIYRQGQLVDQVVSLYLFMPVLWDELKSFVSTHYAHKTRAQPKQSHHVASVPDGLYHESAVHINVQTSAGQVHNDLPLQASIDPFSPTVIPPKLLAGAPQSPQWPRGRRWPSLMYNRFAGSLSQKLPPLLSIAEFIITSASELVDPDEVDLLFIWRGRRCCQTEMSPTTTWRIPKMIAVMTSAERCG